jgi:exosortase/archaeosortase family protein
MSLTLAPPNAADLVRDGLPTPANAAASGSTVDWDLVTRASSIITLGIIAYHRSLATLWRNLALDTPLAYLGLVPVIALVLGIASWRRRPFGPDIHDRQLDFIVGLPLLATALMANALLPTEMSTIYWVRRVDLLTLPVFVAGAVTLLLGVRGLVRVRAAVAFLFLAWPYPYSIALFRWLDGFTNVTIKALAVVTTHLHVAVHDPTGDGSIFNVTHGATTFPLSVASECSGANGLVGFLLVGLAFMTVVRGSRFRKLAWLAVGGAITWALNVARILIVFGVAQRWGEKVAIDGFHPVIGLVLFNLGVLAMMLLMGPFGLRFFEPRPARTARSLTAVAPRRMTLPNWKLGVAITLSGALLMSLMNGGLSRYELVADALGTPRLAPLSVSPAALDGWQPASKIAEYTFARRFFGDTSTWNRYVMQPASTGAAVWANQPVFLDVIDNSDLSRFNAYGIEACYHFHNFEVTDPVTVDLGSGVVGTTMSWKEPQHDSGWTIAFWHWPVLDKGKIRYERAVVMMSNASSVQVRSPGVDFDSTSARLNDVIKRGQLDKVTVAKREAAFRAFVVNIARQIVARQPAATTVKAQQ